MYLDADLAIKQKALASTARLPTERRPHHPGDQLLAFLNGR